MKFSTVLYGLAGLTAFTWFLAAEEVRIAKDGEPCLPVVSEVMRGKVVNVKDADTIAIVRDRKLISVRFEGIDAPETGQDHGTKAKQALGEWIHGKVVEIHVTGIDDYKRTLGYVFLDGVNINEKLVREGWAWHYTDYNCDPMLAKAEVYARSKQHGLWDHDRPIPPWEYRKLLRERRALAAERARSKRQTARDLVPTKPVIVPSKVRPSAPTLSYWLNTNSGVRHNSTCQHYGNTKAGRSCSGSDGRACGICGG
ncbi:Thermonuclease precursor [Thalassoglobus neptunius]|uniref:Thermonuclease n=1 Tax=Thalassoglobus neptunius TaxID=1938619 RepID=A0A5C5WG01_9PLAN|nr:thermonuclease family protein [Thalassoglobus neptunius]TWT49041.1 Thermonuclease precursor [Thalassoglobus neptunius]